MAQLQFDKKSPLHAGLVVDGKYRLLELVGEGAMGSVWRALHVSLRHPVAVKFLRGATARSAELRVRFEREARIAARLGEASRHVARTLDHGLLPDGTPFLVMELLRGEGLDSYLDRVGPMPLVQIAGIVNQLARALWVAHQAGVVHRDLKPANVFLCDGGEDGVIVKLLDFGVAKSTIQSEDSLATREGAIIGTPVYMSPEQIAGRPVDHRSDLFALAGIVYRMATGRAAFGTGELRELAMRIIATEPTTPSAVRSELGTAFDDLMERALAKRPDHRFQDARAFADALAVVAGVRVSEGSGSFSIARAEALKAELCEEPPTVVDAPAPTVERSEPFVMVPKRRAHRLFPAVIGALLSLTALAAVSLHKAPAPELVDRVGPSPLPRLTMEPAPEAPAQLAKVVAQIAPKPAHASPKKSYYAVKPAPAPVAEPAAAPVVEATEQAPVAAIAPQPASTESWEKRDEM